MRVGISRTESSVRDRDRSGLNSVTKEKEETFRKNPGARLSCLSRPLPRGAGELINLFLSRPEPFVSPLLRARFARQHRETKSISSLRVGAMTLLQSDSS